MITAAEILVSITCLEFSYTQAPPQMKSFIMSPWTDLSAVETMVRQVLEARD